MFWTVYRRARLLGSQGRHDQPRSIPRGAHGPVGLRTNCVAPGTIDTPMIADLLATGVLEQDATRFTFVPLGRAAQPDEVAHAVLFQLRPQPPQSGCQY
jgi:NAD(P)-dependent dehydrogenase (short-subunit alcohol dehydrogenase family)